MSVSAPLDLQVGGFHDGIRGALRPVDRVALYGDRLMMVGVVELSLGESLVASRVQFAATVREGGVATVAGDMERDAGRFTNRVALGLLDFVEKRRFAVELVLKGLLSPDPLQCNVERRECRSHTVRPLVGPLLCFKGSGHYGQALVIVVGVEFLFPRSTEWRFRSVVLGFQVTLLMCVKD